MPGMNGDEVLKEILGTRGDARVLLTSGYKEEDVRHRFDVGGMTGFVQKPFLLAALVDRICSVIAPPGPQGPPETSTAPA